MAYSRLGKVDAGCKQAAVGVLAAVCDGVVGVACPCQLQKQDDTLHGCERLKYACSCGSSPAVYVECSCGSLPAVYVESAAFARVRLLCMYSAYRSRDGVLLVLGRHCGVPLRLSYPRSVKAARSLLC
jgi:hypothetical protein